MNTTQHAANKSPLTCSLTKNESKVITFISYVERNRHFDSSYDKLLQKKEIYSTVSWEIISTAHSNISMPSVHVTITSVSANVTGPVAPSRRHKNKMAASSSISGKIVFMLIVALSVNI